MAILAFQKPDKVLMLEANDFYGKPQDAVDWKKMRNLIYAADAYLRYYAIDLPVRFDVITITGSIDKPYIKHFEQAFRP